MVVSFENSQMAYPIYLDRHGSKERGNEYVLRMIRSVLRVFLSNV